MGTVASCMVCLHFRGKLRGLGSVIPEVQGWTVFLFL